MIRKLLSVLLSVSVFTVAACNDASLTAPTVEAPKAYTVTIRRFIGGDGYVMAGTQIPDVNARSFNLISVDTAVTLAQNAGKSIFIGTSGIGSWGSYSLDNVDGVPQTLTASIQKTVVNQNLGNPVIALDSVSPQLMDIQQYSFWTGARLAYPSYSYAGSPNGSTTLYTFPRRNVVVVGHTATIGLQCLRDGVADVVLGNLDYKTVLGTTLYDNHVVPGRVQITCLMHSGTFVGAANRLSTP